MFKLQLHSFSRRRAFRPLRSELKTQLRMNNWFSSSGWTVCWKWGPFPLVSVFLSQQWVLLGDLIFRNLFFFHKHWMVKLKCFLTSFSGCVLWVGMFSGCCTKYCSKYKGVSAEGREGKKPRGDVETIEASVSPLRCLTLSAHYPFPDLNR